MPNKDGCMTRCCCGKVNDVGEGLIKNDIQHMPIDTGSFCGPVYKHIIANLQAKITELEADKKILYSFYDSVSCLFVEGVEFCNKVELYDAIKKEWNKTCNAMKETP